MQLLPTICLFKLKIFVNMLLLLLSPMNEYSNNPGTCTENKNETCCIKNFYYDLYNAKPIRSTDWAVKGKLLKQKCKNSNVAIPELSLGIQYRVSWDGRLEFVPRCSSRKPTQDPSHMS